MTSQEWFIAKKKIQEANPDFLAVARDYEQNSPDRVKVTSQGKFTRHEIHCSGGYDLIFYQDKKGAYATAYYITFDHNKGLCAKRDIVDLDQYISENRTKSRYSRD